MAVKTIVDDYVLAAMLRAKGGRAERGTIVLTVPDLPGLVACGANAREAYDELYRRLENLVLKCVGRGDRLPVLPLDDTVIDLNTPMNHTLANYHRGQTSEDEASVGVDSPEALERFFDSP